MSEKEKLMSWLRRRTAQRDRIRRMVYGDKQVDEWEAQIREHFKGKSCDLIIEDDLEEIEP